MTHKGYRQPGPCVAWHFQGRDGRWYRVCVPCDSARPGPVPGMPWNLPDHLRYGYKTEHDAEQSARDHAKATDALRRMLKLREERTELMIHAAQRGDVDLWARMIMMDHRYEIPEERREASREHMALWLARVTS